MSSESKKGSRLAIQVLLFGCAILLLIVGINYLRPNAIQPGQSTVYPPPEQANGNPVPTDIPYPGPYWVLLTVKPTPTCCWWGLPTLGSIDPKSGATLSPSQIAEVATFAYSKSHILSVPTPTLPSMPFSTIAGLPQSISDLPIYANDSCIQAGEPGQILPVKSLMAEYPDYYLVPFYDQDIPCKVLVVIIGDGKATIWPELPFLDKVFPSVSAEEAANYVIDKTGLQVTDQPTLVFKQFREQVTVPTEPCWQVTTTGGQVFYVFFIVGIFDGQEVTTHVYIYNQDELHPLQ